MKISFVVPFIHEYPGIETTIYSIQSEMMDNPYDYEIIVAENGVIDPNTISFFTGNKATFQGAQKIRYIFDDRQCGPISRNTGAKISTGDYLFFCDAHSILGKNTIAPMADFLTDHPNVGIVAGLTLKGENLDWDRAGAFYELFGGGGGPTLFSHMHGHYMPRGFIPHMDPVPVVMASQAYIMYRRQEFLDSGGYFEGCRFYPHPEGYMALKYWMMGKEFWLFQRSYHFHSTMHRTYEIGPVREIFEKVRAITMDKSIDGLMKIEDINKIYKGELTDEGIKKRDEYGGKSWYWHGVRNILMIAYILGGEWWLNECAKQQLEDPRENISDWLNEIKYSAVETVEKLKARDFLLSKTEQSLDGFLQWARKEQLWGLKKHIYNPDTWDKRLGLDPFEGGNNN